MIETVRPTQVRKFRLPYYAPITLGCDPEVFIRNKDTGMIVGSEKVFSVASSSIGSIEGSIVRDGVQVELHPRPSCCRATLGCSIQTCFVALREQLRKTSTNMVMDISRVVEVDRLDLSQLDEKSRILGCMPSSNAYGRESIKIDPFTNIRTGAGHIHIGLTPGYEKNFSAADLTRVMDILVGNTCVLLDRDPSSAIRRKMYGRAGEFRTPIHGVEYRTLSNFWLHSYPLMSLVMGLTRIAVRLALTESMGPYYKAGTGGKTRHETTSGQIITTTPWLEAKDELFRSIDLEFVEETINENNFDAAYTTFCKSVSPFLEQLYVGYGLDCELIDFFHHFVKRINANGMEYWFPDDPLTHWCDKTGYGSGWESFCWDTIAGDMARGREA